MQDLIEQVKLAIELEKKGYDFYSKSAADSKNPLLSATLASLAEREFDHIERIRQIQDQLLKDEKQRSDWLKNVFVPPSKNELIESIVKRLGSISTKAGQETDNLTRIYETALEFERNSVALYEKLAGQQKDKIIKDFFLALVKEENEHFEILDETMKYLNNPGDWFKEQERWIVEG